jgi:hypothetical protein
LFVFLEEFVNLRCFIAFTVILSLLAVPTARAQVDSVIGQFTSASADSYAGSISGDGRLVVFESRGNLATENPRNSDGNTEIFLWDYAQRRTYQITDTKSVLKNTFGFASQDNIRIDISNKRPVISQNGLWIAFASNATASIISTPDGLNPGSFDGNTYNTQDPLPTTGCPVPTPTPTPTATPTATPTPSPTATPTGTPAPTPTPTSTPFNNPLQCDGNMELWLYQVPALAPADLTSGDPVPVSNLSGGTFSRITNTPPSRYPQEGTALRTPFIADDNHDVSINDDGNRVAFVSTRDLVPGGNPFPTEDNDEIFTFTRSGGTATVFGDELKGQNTKAAGSKGLRNMPETLAVAAGAGGGVIAQVTRTLRGTVQKPIYNKNPAISGDGARLVFASSGNDPIIGMTGGNNPTDTSYNEEVFVSDLDSSGAPTGIRRQVTVTAPTNPGDPVNFLDYGKRISRNGNLIAFDSFADLANENSGTNHTSFATYLYDVTANTFRRIGARSNADEDAPGGDVARYPGFTDYDLTGNPATLVLETRMNILPNGTVATTAGEGLNPDSARPVQFSLYALDVPAASATFTRITKFPISNTFLAQSQPLTSDSSSRLAFNFGLTELGGGNQDLLSEVYYLYTPEAAGDPVVDPELAFVTGASNLPILPTGSPSPTPTPGTTPTPTPTPTPTATPTPTPTPTPTGSPSPTPTPVTPAAVLGISPGMLARINFEDPLTPAVTPRTAIGNINQTFMLPMSLSNLTMTIGGHTVGLKSVNSNYVEFVVPRGLPSAIAGANYPVVINNQGSVIKGWVTIVPARPDLFSTVFGPGGRAQAVNFTNRVHTPEPFTVTTVEVRGGDRVPSRIRLRLTGVEGAGPANFNIRIGNQTILGTTVLSGGVLVEPGVYTVDFQLPAGLNGAGDQPIVVNIVVGSNAFASRLDDTAPRLRIL